MQPPKRLKQSEEKLRDSEELFRSLVQNVSDVITILEADGTIRFVSPAIERVMGYHPEERVGTNTFNVVHPDDLEQASSMFNEILKAPGVHQPLEFRMLHKDGSWHHLEHIVNNLLHEPTIMGIVVTSRDITDRKRTEDALRKARDRFRVAFDNAPIGMAMVSLEGRYLQVNRSLCEILGASEDELLATTWQEITHPDDLAANLTYARRIVEGKIPKYHLEKRFLRVDGHTVWVSLSVSLVRGAQGKPLYFVSQIQDVTQRKEAEARYTTLLSNEPALVYRRLNEPGWPDVFVSDYAMDLTGYSPMDLLVGGDVRYSDLIVEEDRPKVWAEVQGALAEHRRFGLRYSIRRKDGEMRHVQEYGQGISVEDGGVEIIEGVVYDVTETVRSEERLREAEERYRTLVERVPDFVYIQEFEELSRSVYVSPQNEAILGYFPEEYLADPVHWIKIMHPDDRDRVLTKNGCTSESVGTFAMEYRQFARDGRTVWIKDEATLVRDEGGKPLYWLGVQTDVTKRKEAEAALRESEERFRRAFDDAAVGMALVAPDGRFLQTNRSLCEILGYSEEELLSKTFQDITHPDDLDADLDHLRRMLAGEIGTYQMEKRYLHKEGHVVWALLSVSLLHDEEGEPLYFVSQIQDVTERKKAEEDLREANRRLSELAVLKADFTAMVAHELDTPLAVIRGYAEMLTTGELQPSEQSRVLAKIHAETEVLNALVADVRTAAAVEREDFAIEPQPVSIHVLLDDAVQVSAVLLENHPLVVENAADERVWADPNRIRQVLRNLLSNAAKYSPEDLPIELRAKPGDNPDRIRIEVADHGYGIHPDDVQRVFEKFGRARDRYGRKVAGIGLGLYLSRRIIRAHGSDLTLSLGPEDGSVFTFDLEAVR